MFTAKERVLLDKDGNCVAADDVSGVQVLAGFKGAQISEKQLRVGNVKGFRKFFTGGPLDAAPDKEHGEPSAKRVLPESQPAANRPATIKK